MSTNTKITRVEGKSGEWVKLHDTHNGVEVVLEGTHLLVAGGRTPNTSGINLELAGVETTEHGFVKVNERLQTTAEGMWASGIVPAAPTSPISLLMIFASCETTSPAEIA